jgi:hypothetical protein
MNFKNFSTLPIWKVARPTPPNNFRTIDFHGTKTSATSSPWLEDDVRLKKSLGWLSRLRANLVWKFWSEKTKIQFFGFIKTYFQK